MTRRSTAARIAIFGSAITGALALAQAASAQLYKDPSQPIPARVADLVGRMTLEEKAQQMQNTAPAIPRLDVPAYDYWNEALHGVARAGEATMFPQAIGMAATWDADLMHEEGRVVAVEGRAKYNQAQREKNFDRYYGLTFWSPNINIFRDPRWGRGQETLGEDPYLTGTLGTQFILGVQGNDPKYFEAIATPKHFAVHSGPEPLRHGFNVNVAPRDLTETYLPQFRRAITEGKAQSLMCAYNAIDGQAACANHTLLGDILRRDWGFQGFITSDCGAVDDVTTGHHQTKTQAEGAALTVKTGTDTGCDFKDEMLELPSAVKQGFISEADIDVALKRLFTARMRLGMFDPPEMVPFSKIGIDQNHNEAHQTIALRAARESIVLLKNDGTLPLAATHTRIAVVGPTATSLIGLEGNYNGTPTKPILPLDGIESEFGKASVSYAQGAPFTAEVAVPVPRTAFPGGLTATFYNSDDLSGTAVATRTDKEVDFNWASVDPAPGVNRHTFSVRWTGKIQVPAPGDYEFQFETRRRCDVGNGPEGYMIHIAGADDQKVVVKCNGRDQSFAPMKVHFSDTNPRDFTLEFTHAASAASDISFAWKAPLDALRNEAVANARNADVVVAFLGLNAWLEGEEMPLKVPGFDGGDRTSIALPAAQLELLDALEATGKPVVIVLQSGSAIALGADNDKARAVLEAWYPGEQGGQAIAEVLKGSVNPSGRLPVTFYKSTAELPPFVDYSMKNRTYRYFAGATEYSFGHGLSYTSFTYSTPTFSTKRVAAGKDQLVKVRVRNVGKREGDEVAQLYIATPGIKGTPLKSLKGYQRVHLSAGEIKTITFRLTPRDMAFADAKGVMRILPATYQLWVGGGQQGTGAPGAAGAFQVEGVLGLPR